MSNQFEKTLFNRTHLGGCITTLVESHTPTGGREATTVSGVGGPRGSGGRATNTDGIWWREKGGGGGRAVGHTAAAIAQQTRERLIMGRGKRSRDNKKEERDNNGSYRWLFIFRVCLAGRKRGRGNVDGSKCVLLYIFYVQKNFS